MTRKNIREEVKITNADCPRVELEISGHIDAWHTTYRTYYRLRDTITLRVLEQHEDPWIAMDRAYVLDGELAAQDRASNKYRACYWAADDGQGEVVLTGPDHSRLTNEKLEVEAREEAARSGVSLDRGELEIGLWQD